MTSASPHHACACREQHVAMLAKAALDIALQADFCVRWLKAQGLAVLRVGGDALQPRIIISPSPLCEKFEDVVRGYARGPKGEQRYGQIFRLGCEVRWLE
jgi:hypothetical protein